MGQAKKRGTFEQRQADAIQREADILERSRVEQLARNEQRRLADMANPKEAAARKRSRMSAMLMSATVLALTCATPQKKEG